MLQCHDDVAHAFAFARYGTIRINYHIYEQPRTG